MKTASTFVALSLRPYAIGQTYVHGRYGAGVVIACKAIGNGAFENLIEVI